MLTTAFMLYYFYLTLNNKVLLMENKKYIEDLKDIKEMMSRSSRFISLSGLAGISTGSIALVGAYLAYRTVYASYNYMTFGKVVITSEALQTLIAIALSVLFLSIISCVYFTSRESSRQGQPVWTAQTKRLLINLAIPLVVGGILCLLFLFKGFVGLVAPLTLIFYGLALVNASKYTLGEIRSLGLFEIGLGLLATHFIGYGLLFWALGFGVLHIVYGVLMHLKYRS